MLPGLHRRPCAPGLDGPEGGGAQRRAEPHASTTCSRVVARGGGAGRPPGGWVDFGGYDQRTLDRPLTRGGTGHRQRRTQGVPGPSSPGTPAWSTRAVLELLPGGVSRTRRLPRRGRHGRGAAARPPYALDELADGDRARPARACRSEGVTACAEAGIGGAAVRPQPGRAAPPTSSPTRRADCRCGSS